MMKQFSLCLFFLFFLSFFSCKAQSLDHYEFVDYEDIDYSSYRYCTKEVAMVVAGFYLFTNPLLVDPNQLNMRAAINQNSQYLDYDSNCIKCMEKYSAFLLKEALVAPKLPDPISGMGLDFYQLGMHFQWLSKAIPMAANGNFYMLDNGDNGGVVDQLRSLAMIRNTLTPSFLEEVNKFMFNFLVNHMVESGI